MPFITIVFSMLYYGKVFPGTLQLLCNTKDIDGDSLLSAIVSTRDDNVVFIILVNDFSSIFKTRHLPYLKLLISR